MANVAEPEADPDAGDLSFRALLEAFPAAVYTTDAEGVLTFYNAAAAALAGRTPQIGRDKWCVSWRLYRPDGAPLPLDQCPMALTLKTGEPVRNVDVIAERPDGTRIPVMPFPTPLYDERGRLAGAVNVLVDISAAKRAEAQAARRADEQAALCRFTDRLYRAETMDEVYDAALDAILAALRCSRASILMFDPAGVMQFVAARGLSAGYRQAVAGHTPWTLGETEPRPIGVDDIERADIDDALKAAIREEGIAALAFIPIVANGGVIGKFMTYYDRPHAFTEEELALALTIAHQIGSSVETARADASLKASEGRYRAVVESQAEMICRFRPDGAILFVNDAYARSLEMTPDAVIGKSFWDFVPAADRAQVQAELDALTPERPEARVENRFLTAAGERWTLWTNRALAFGSDGRCIEAQSTGIDITERKQVEQALRKSEAEFRALADNIHQLAWMTDATGWVYWYNKRWLDYTGGSLEDMQGEGWRRVQHPDHVDRVTESFRRAIAAGELWEDTFPLRGKSGEYRWFLSRAVPIRDEQGAIVRWFGTNTDITDWRDAEETRQMLSSIVECSEDAIVAKDLNSFIMTWNRGAERIFGYAAEEMIGRSVLTIIPEELQTQEQDILDRIRRGERVDHFETVRQRKDGKPIHVSLTVSPVKDSQGRIVGAAKIARDITERKRAEEQRNLLINELNHRVKNTLATVQSLALQTLRNTERSEDARKVFDARLSALSRAHDVLTAENWEGANLREVVARALEAFSGDRVRVDGPEVRLTPRQALALSIALHELATNAAKYGALSNGRGTVDVRWSVVRAGEAQMLELRWTERGGPPVALPIKRGFGSRLIERSLANELGGAASIEFAREGVCASIASPLERGHPDRGAS